MDSASNKRDTQINFLDILDSVKPVKRNQAHPPNQSAPPTSSKRKRTISPQRHHAKYHENKSAGNTDTIATKSSPRELALVRAAENGVDTIDHTVVRRGSPWDWLRKDYELNLGGFVSIASDRAFPHDVFIVKHLSGPDALAKAQMLRKVRHDTFHNILQCFGFEDSFYAVFEHVPISLAHVAKSPPYLTEHELAAILGQILEGLTYLASNGLEHGSLTCSNILLNVKGEIKISGIESCHEVPSSLLLARDARALGYITMELMQKYVNDGGAIGLEDFDRWPSDGHAVDFLAMTTSANSVDKLLQHPLLRCNWEKEDLKWLFGIASVTHRGFKYQDRE